MISSNKFSLYLSKRPVVDHLYGFLGKFEYPSYFVILLLIYLPSCRCYFAFVNQLLYDVWKFSLQVAALADDILKNVQFDALRIVFNKFHSVVSFVPTVSTILSPEVLLSRIRNCYLPIFLVLLLTDLKLFSCKDC